MNGEAFDGQTPPEKPEGETTENGETLERPENFKDFNGKVVYDATRKEEPVDQRYPKRVLGNENNEEVVEEETTDAK